MAARVLCGRETAWLTVEPDAGEDGSISTERMLEPADIDNELVVLLAGRAAESFCWAPSGQVPGRRTAHCACNPSAAAAESHWMW
ncbi:hypothetical protein [Marivita cryptomonadis]|uniref:hypothetical protein n=1 Tax=Marivita cryptomonadis TaxID=505252 RepID=UPI00391B3DDF